MKSFRYNKNGKVIRGYKEEPLPKRRVNWDRIIYLIIFFIILASLIIYVFRRTYFVSSYGEVITSKFEVKFADDVKVVDYLVDENEKVKRGDTLMIVRPEIPPKDTLGLVSQENDANTDWIEKEKISTQKSISLKRIGLQRTKDEIKEVQQQISSQRNEVYLGLNTAGILTATESKAQNLKADEKMQQEEIRYLRTYYAKLLRMEREMSRVIRQVFVIPRNVPFISPIDGVVSQIFARKDEVNYRQEVAMDLINFNKVYIMAYLDQEYFQYFKVGDTVGVKFGNGMKSLGVISNIYMNTAELPSEFHKTYQKTPRTVLARIDPVNAENVSEWKPYYKMGVTVYRPKMFYHWWLNYREKHVDNESSN